MLTCQCWFARRPPPGTRRRLSTPNLGSVAGYRRSHSRRDSVSFGSNLCQLGVDPACRPAQTTYYLALFTLAFLSGAPGPQMQAGGPGAVAPDFTANEEYPNGFAFAARCVSALLLLPVTHRSAM